MDRRGEINVLEAANMVHKSSDISDDFSFVILKNGANRSFFRRRMTNEKYPLIYEK
jgi:hypothetical protein